MMNDERFTTDGYHINDTYNKKTWLLDKTNAQEIVDMMNGLDNYKEKVLELEKENEILKNLYQKE